MDDIKHLVYLHYIGFTHSKLFKVFDQSRDYRWVYEGLNINKLLEYGFSYDKAEFMISKYQNLNTQKVDRVLDDLDVSIITYYDIRYPQKLLHISNTPYLLYVRWNLNLDSRFLWVVGSRKMSQYAKKSGEYIIPKLSKYFTIVSGWAGWSDSLAHRVTIDSGGATISVFGTGIDVVYPTSNRWLFSEIVEKSWALISSFPLWTMGSKYTFPVRNEIVSGLSEWVLILEAWEKSWTLITAQLALDQGRDVFVVPGDIFSSNYAWSNNLIKSWQAKLVSSSEDILEDFGFNSSVVSEQEIVFDNHIKRDIYELLKYNLWLSIDDILQKTNYTYIEVSTNLTMMELSGLVKKNMLWKYEI